MCNAFNYVAHTGRLVFVGIVTDEVHFRRSALPPPRDDALRLAQRPAGATSTRIIGLIEDGRIDTRPWITHRTPFDELIGEFPSYTQPETGVIKAMVEVEDRQP